MRSLPNLAALVAALPLPAQEPPPQPAPGRIELRIECTKRGTPVVRDPKTEAEKLAFQLVGREVRWSVGETACASTDELRVALRRVMSDRKAWVPDPDKFGQMKPPDVHVTAQPGVCWNEVVAAHDCARKAGFQIVLLPGVSPSLQVRWRAAAKGCFDDGATIVPRKQYQEPDVPPDPYRPRFDVLQDGRIRLHGEVLFDPEHDDATTDAITERLHALGEAALERKELETEKAPGADRQRTSTPVLVVADKWVDWSHVERLLACCGTGDHAFWKVDLQVAKEDAEAIFVQERAGK